jgi:hypothetical protein
VSIILPNHVSEARQVEMERRVLDLRAILFLVLEEAGEPAAEGGYQIVIPAAACRADRELPMGELKHEFLRDGDRVTGMRVWWERG